jgi:hypothetical protein
MIFCDRVVDTKSKLQDIILSGNLPLTPLEEHFILWWAAHFPVCQFMLPFYLRHRKKVLGMFAFAWTQSSHVKTWSVVIRALLMKLKALHF